MGISLADIIEKIFGVWGSITLALMTAAVLVTMLVIRVNRTKKRVDGIEKVIDGIQKAIQKMASEISSLKFFLRRGRSYTERLSPVALSKEGKEVAESLSLESIVSDNWKDIRSRLTKKQEEAEDDTPYTLQTVCFEIAEEYSNFLKKEELEKVKTFAYHEGVDISSFSPIFAIIIRDKYFAEKGMNVSNANKAQPQKE